MIRILGISGSLRTRSTNTEVLLATAVPEPPPDEKPATAWPHGAPDA
jgi:NAD(P)H-dependent FMN reductase